MKIDGTTLDAAVMVDMVLRVGATAWVNSHTSCRMAAEHLERILQEGSFQDEEEKVLVQAAIAVYRKHA